MWAKNEKKKKTHIEKTHNILVNPSGLRGLWPSNGLDPIEKRFVSLFIYAKQD